MDKEDKEERRTKEEDKTCRLGRKQVALTELSSPGEERYPGSWRERPLTQSGIS